jgi:hypothetical protein
MCCRCVMVRQVMDTSVSLVSAVRDGNSAAVAAHMAAGANVTQDYVRS